MKRGFVEPVRLYPSTGFDKEVLQAAVNRIEGKKAMASTKKFTPLRTQREEELLRAARKYGRMAKLGYYVEDNMIVRVSHADIKRYTELFEYNLKEAAESIITSMTVDEDGHLVE